MEYYENYPIVCYSCAKPLNHLEASYKTLLETMTNGEALTTLGLHRPCCRERMTNPSIKFINMYQHSRQTRPYTFSEIKTPGLPTKPNVPSITDSEPSIEVRVSPDYPDYYVPIRSGRVYLAE